MRPFLLFLALFLHIFSNLPLSAQTITHETVTRGPVTNFALPRFASLKYDRVNARTGPGKRFPIRHVYLRANLPLQIIDEFEHWRLIKDHEDIESWVHYRQLSGKRSLRIAKDKVPLRKNAKQDAKIRAFLQEGVIVSIKTCANHWCQVSAGKIKGWVQAKYGYGTYQNEVFE